MDMKKFNKKFVGKKPEVLEKLLKMVQMIEA